MARISLVSGICMLPDAISYSVVAKANAISGLGLSADVRVFSHQSNWNDPRSVTVNSAVELAADEFFRTSDIVCYEFGIHYSLFDTIFLLPRSVKKAAVYHNITPLQFAADDRSRQIIRRSLTQRANLMYCDHVACVSSFNRAELLAFGLPPERATVLNLPLKLPFTPTPQALPDARDPIEILFVGRFVPSKGVLDLVEAAARAMRAGASVRVSLVGDTTFSDPDYLAQIERAIGASRHPEAFQFVGSVSAEDLAAHYGRAHIVAIASYHEGYCLPVIEALSSGCAVATYDAGNLPYIVNGLGRIVQTGDARALGDAIFDLAEALADTSVAPEERRLPLDCGRLSAHELRERSAEYLQRFSVEAYQEGVRDLFARLGVGERRPAAQAHASVS